MGFIGPKLDAVVPSSWVGCLVACKLLPAGLPQSGKLPVLNLLSPKISIFTLQGRLIALIHLKFGMAEGTVGLLIVGPLMGT